MVALLGHRIEELRSVLGLTEEEARAMLERQVPLAELECPRCSARKLYALGRYRRCSKCRYTFARLAGRWLGRNRIGARAWVLALKAFEVGLPADTAAQLTGLTRDSLYRVFHSIRLSLAARDPRWRDALLGRQSAAGAVFAVRSDGAMVRLAPLGDDAVRAVMANPPAELHRDGVVFTAPYGRYAALVSDGRLALGRRGLEGEPSEPFLRFLELQTARHYSISPKSFPLYLMEWELRFNRRGKPWFDELLRAVTRLSSGLPSRSSSGVGFNPRATVAALEVRPGLHRAGLRTPSAAGTLPQAAESRKGYPFDRDPGKPGEVFQGVVRRPCE